MKKTLIILALTCSPVLAQQGQAPQMPDLDGMFFKQFDTNQDGRVSKSEFMQPTEAQFDQMDKNRDGELDAAEVKAFNQEMQQRIQEMQRQMQQQMQQQGKPLR